MAVLVPVIITTTVVIIETIAIAIMVDTPLECPVAVLLPTVLAQYHPVVVVMQWVVVVVVIIKIVIYSIFLFYSSR
jgi:hypothetical protein